MLKMTNLHLLCIKLLTQYRDVENDQWGRSHFNWTLDNGTNYHILRTGCYPYMKYHCTKRPIQDLSLDDRFMKFIKIINLGKLQWFTHCVVNNM